MVLNFHTVLALICSLLSLASGVYVFMKNPKSGVHRGKLRVKSEAGFGSEFIIELPVETSGVLAAAPA